MLPDPEIHELKKVSIRDRRRRRCAVYQARILLLRESRGLGTDGSDDDQDAELPGKAGEGEPISNYPENGGKILLDGILQPANP